MIKLYIFGVQRSGTTLLAALLGAHSDINMLSQSVTGDQNKLIGKKYQGNKLCVPSDIRWKKKTTRIKSLLYIKTKRILKAIGINIVLSPSARFNIQDLLKENCKIIKIYRSKEANIQSIVKRTGVSNRKAEKHFYEGQELLNKIPGLTIDYNTLTSSTVETLKEICKYLEIEYEPKMFDGVNNMLNYNHDRIIEQS